MQNHRRNTAILACFVRSVLLFSMQGLLASFTGSLACFVRSVLLFSMQGLLASFTGFLACFVRSVLCKVCSLVSLALLLALCALSCCFLCKVCSLVSDARLVAFDTYAFRSLSDKLQYSAFLLLRNTCWQDLHTFSLNLASRHDSQNSRNFRPSSLQWEKMPRGRNNVHAQSKNADCLYAYYAGRTQISATEHIQKKRLD